MLAYIAGAAMGSVIRHIVRNTPDDNVVAASSSSTAIWSRALLTIVKANGTA
jgi:hypothetical protein